VIKSISNLTQIFSVTWSYRNHSNMMIWCSRNIFFFIKCLKQLSCLIFLWKPWYIFKILWWMLKKEKKNYFKISEIV